MQAPRRVADVSPTTECFGKLGLRTLSRSLACFLLAASRLPPCWEGLTYETKVFGFRKKYGREKNLRAALQVLGGSWALEVMKMELQNWQAVSVDFCY